MRIPFLSIFLCILFICELFSTNTFAQSSALRINEFCANNYSILQDEDGEASDWIELFNSGENNISLKGWSITDSKELTNNWTFPDIIIKAKSFLIVFASGKNRLDEGHELHTNFKLSSSGEYLALINSSKQLVSEFKKYPPQSNDVSYAWNNSEYLLCSNPSPGTENNDLKLIIEPPTFSVPHGFFNAPFQLRISAANNSKIYYTTDGSIPTTNDIPYNSPITINKTTVLRAIAVFEKASSKPSTQSYLFIDDIIHQTGTIDLAIRGKHSNSSLDITLNPELLKDPASIDSIKSGLLDIPSISIVFNENDLFSSRKNSQTAGIYVYTEYNWEKPVSIEYFNSKDSGSFQINAGLRIQGGSGREFYRSPKHSFRVYFRKKYGVSKLQFPFFGENATQTFNDLTLRAGYNNSIIHNSVHERRNAQYIRDPLIKDTQIAMGYPGAHSKYVHLYLNGMYWGLYTASERFDNDFCQSYLKENKQKFDIINDNKMAIYGSTEPWNTFVQLSNNEIDNPINYYLLQGKDSIGNVNPNYIKYLDPVKLIDYMLLNFYAGNQDWDHNNWIVAINKENPKDGFLFFCWDAERTIEDLDHSVVNENNANCPSGVFQNLLKNKEFKRLVEDRILELFFDDGELTPKAMANRYKSRANQLQKAIFAESARWGVYRLHKKDRHNTKNKKLYYTKEEFWTPELKYRLNEYFPKRTDVVIKQLKKIGYYPELDAPQIKTQNIETECTNLRIGDTISMNSDIGNIYYTTDGSDPVVWNDNIAESDENSTNEKHLVRADAEKYVLVPKKDIGNGWKEQLDYDTQNWTKSTGSPGGVGYEIGSGYENYISVDVQDKMYKRFSTRIGNFSCFVRIPFVLDQYSIEDNASLYLKIRYDDGFVAYLNGKQVASDNAPHRITWNCAATEAVEARNYKYFDITNVINELKTDSNILAIHGMNNIPGSDDFLIDCELVMRKNVTLKELSANAILYDKPIKLGKSTLIRTRALHGDKWSAMKTSYFAIPDDYKNLKISEIYNPNSTDDKTNNVEFIELKNTGNAILSLHGLFFSKGIKYTFNEEKYLQPGEIIVLASDNYRFYEKYGFLPFGEYKGKLTNASDNIILENTNGDTIISLSYGNDTSWSKLINDPDRSIIPKNIESNKIPSSGKYWKKSKQVGGSPGISN